MDVTKEARAIVLRTIYGSIIDRAAMVSVPNMVAFDHCVQAVEQALTTAQSEAAELRAENARLKHEATIMWRNAVTNTAALIDQARRAHPIGANNKAFARFDADLNDRIEKWFSFTRGASPASYEEAEAEWQRFIRAALKETQHEG